MLADYLVEGSRAWAGWLARASRVWPSAFEGMRSRAGDRGEGVRADSRALDGEGCRIILRQIEGRRWLKIEGLGRCNKGRKMREFSYQIGKGSRLRKGKNVKDISNNKQG